MELAHLKFFGLKEEPFSTVPSPRYFFLTSVHSTALEKTAYVVGAKKGLSVVFGDTGTGKSSLARLLHQKFLDSGFLSSLLINPNYPTPNSLLRTIAQELGTPRSSKSFKGMLDLFKDHLWNKAATDGKTVVLIIDEAQTLKPPLIELLRQLINYETNEMKLLQLVLFGQDELRNTLARASLRNFRSRIHGVAPKSAADFAFLLHGLHYLKDDGVMAIILPHGVLFRGGVEERIRRKLLDDGHIDTVIGLPANLFYSTGIPVCILVLKKCKKPDDVLFINAAEHFVRGKRQNQLSDEHINRIVGTYQNRLEEERYSRRVTLKEIADNDYNLNISRYISTAEAEAEIDLEATHAELVRLESELREATTKHNTFLQELGLPPLPCSGSTEASRVDERA